MDAPRTRRITGTASLGHNLQIEDPDALVRVIEQRLPSLAASSTVPGAPARALIRTDE